MLNSDEVRISGIVEESIVDGIGIRYVIFTQGCPHNCKGCHNPNSHDFSGGKVVSTNTIIEEIKENPLISGVTFSGGEPFCQPKPLIKIADEVSKIQKDIWAFSGYTFDELLDMDEDVKTLLSLCDVLVDGQFILEQKSLSLKFKGSKNQRLIDVKKTFASGEIVLLQI